MGTKAKERLSCRALGFLNAISLPAAHVTADEVFLELAQSRSPIGVRTEKASPRHLVPTVVAALSKQGFEPLVALAAARAVLVSPTVALRRDGASGVECLQACLFRTADDPSACIRVVVTAVVAAVKPPEVRDVAVDVDLVDPEDSAVEIVAELERWHRAYPNPESSPPENSGPRSIGWVGSPSGAGYRDVPPDWQKLIEATARVFGTRMRVASSVQSAARMSMGVREDLVFVLKAGSRSPFAGQGPANLIVVGQPGSPFNEVLDEFRDEMLTSFYGAQTGESIQRNLMENEIIYHRKIRSSRHFDTFDQGSGKPCVHNGRPGTFQPWSNAPKAIKGMQRRYGNFIPTMLQHCSRYPNCGMYMVDAGSLTSGSTAD